MNQDDQIKMLRKALETAQAALIAAQPRDIQPPDWERHEKAINTVACALHPPSLSASAEPVKGEPFAWATFDGEGGYDLRLYENNEGYREAYLSQNGAKYANWIILLYRDAPPPTMEAAADGPMKALREVEAWIDSLPIPTKGATAVGRKLQNAIAVLASSPSAAPAKWCKVCKKERHGPSCGICGTMTTELPSAAPALSDEELPGMWSNSDLSGGATDCAAPQEPGELPPLPEGAASFGHMRVPGVFHLKETFTIKNEHRPSLQGRKHMEEVTIDLYTAGQLRAYALAARSMQAGSVGEEELELDDLILAALADVNSKRMWDTLTYETGPYDIHKPTVEAGKFVVFIARALLSRQVAAVPEWINQPTLEMEIAGMEASVLGTPSVDDETYVLSIWDAMCAAAPSAQEGD